MPRVSNNQAGYDTAQATASESTVRHTVELESLELGDQLLRKIVKNSRPIQILDCKDAAAQLEIFQGRYESMYQQYKVLFNASLIDHRNKTIIDDYDPFSAYLKVVDRESQAFLGGCRIIFLKDLPEHLLTSQPGCVFPKMYEHTRPELPQGFDIKKATIISYVFGKDGVGNCTYKKLVSTLGDLLFRESFQHSIENGCKWILLTCKPYMHSYLSSYGFETIYKTFPLNEIGGTDRRLLILDAEKIKDFFTKERQ